MKKIKKTLLHAVAQCSDCNFEDEYFLNAQRSGRNHALKTWHSVIIETGYSQTYNEKSEKE